MDGTIGGYQVLRELGRGAMGVVVAARSVELGRDVAIKLLLAGDQASASQTARFEREARAAARLVHPNVARLLHAGIDRGRPFIVMDLVEGESLAARVRRGGPLPEEEAARLALGVARGLEHAHREGVLHRDVKPANVILRRDGEAVLTDFGLAFEATSQRLTATGTLLGTPSYMAPEQVECGAVDARADVYALGATLFELLAGRPPFAGATPLNVVKAVIADAPPALASLRPRTDPALAAIVHRCLEKEPGRRPQSAGALASELEAWLRARRPGARPVGRSRGPAIAAVVFSFVGAASAIALILSRSATPVASSVEPSAVPAFSATVSAPGPAPVPIDTRDADAAELDRMIEAQPAEPALWRRRAEVRTLQQRFEEARRDIDEALRLAPGDAKCLAVRARIRVGSRDVPGARADLAAASAAGARDAETAFQLGLVHRDLNEIEPARRAFERALELQPDHAWALCRRGEARRVLGDREGALRDQELAIALAPDVARLHAELALTRMSGEDFAGALRDLDRAIALDPGLFMAWLSKASTCLRARRFEEALAAAERALELTPTSRTPRYVRGMARAELGLEGALEDLEWYLRERPDAFEAPEVRAQLEALRRR